MNCSHGLKTLFCEQNEKKKLNHIYYLHILLNHLLWLLFVIFHSRPDLFKVFQWPKPPKKERLNTLSIQQSYIQTSKEVQTTFAEIIFI